MKHTKNAKINKITKEFLLEIGFFEISRSHTMDFISGPKGGKAEITYALHKPFNSIDYIYVYSRQEYTELKFFWSTGEEITSVNELITRIIREAYITGYNNRDEEIKTGLRMLLYKDQVEYCN